MKSYLHLRIGLLIKLQLVSILSIRVVNSIKIALEIGEGKLVSWLEFSVVFVVFLDGIVGQMDKLVVEIFHIEFFGGRADVAVLIPVTFLIPVDASHANVRPDVELALLVEKRHDVLLNDVRASSAHFVSLVTLDDLNDLIDALNDLDAGSSVCVLAWLNKPSVALFSLEAMLKLLVLLLLLFVLDIFSAFLILFLEFSEFLIVEISHMEGHWNVLKRIDLLRIIVIFEIHEESLLVGKVPVIGQMVVDAEVVRTIFVSLHFVSSHLCLYLSLLTNHFKLLELLEFRVREYLPEVVENGPHLRVRKSFLLFPLKLVIDFLFHILAEIDERMRIQRLRVLFHAYSFGLG